MRASSSVHIIVFVCLGLALFTADTGAQEIPQDDSYAKQAAEVTRGVSVPRLMKFGGVVRDAMGVARSGMVGLTFAIYREQEGGSTLWMESQNVELDAEGRYTVLLGAHTRDGLPLDLFIGGEPRWLGVHVQLPGEVEQPRVLLVSVPYALKAADADTLGGRPASAYVLASAPGASSTTGGTTNLQLTASAMPLVVDGMGTPGRIAMFTTPTEIGDSLISQSGVRLGIGGGVDFSSDFSFTGNAEPAATGRVQMFDRAFQGFVIRGLNVIFETLQGSPAVPIEALRVSQSGNVGINEMFPADRLAVRGNIRLLGAGNAIIFPNGTVMSSAATGVGGGTITGVTAGAGLTGGGMAGGVTLNFDTSFGDGRYMRLGTGGFPVNNAGFGFLTITNSASGALQGISSATSGFAAAVHGVTSSPDGSGVEGTNSASTGDAVGVRGFSGSEQGRGVFGRANSLTGSAIGVSGESLSSSGIGVSGRAFSTSGLTVGVDGFMQSPNGAAIRGLAFSNTGNALGVAGTSQAENGTGVLGFAAHTTGQVVGVHGNTQSSGGIGVKATNSGDTGTALLAEAVGNGANIGIHARSNSPTGIVGMFEGSSAAVLLTGRQFGGNEVFRVSGAGDVTASGFLNPAGVSVALPTTCSNSQVVKWNGTAWACAADVDTNSGGTVNSITAGTGLTGGTITSSGTIALDTAFGDARYVTSIIPGTGLAGGGSGGAVMLALNAAVLTRAITYLAGCDSCDLLTDADDQRTFYANILGPMMITEVTCFSNAGTPTINLLRDDGTPADILGSDLGCSTTGTTTSVFSGSENLLSLNDKLDFVVVSAGGVARRVTVSIKAVLN